MKIAINDLRKLIREALEEMEMHEESVGQEEKANDAPPPAAAQLEEMEMHEEAWSELEEAWSELEEVSGLHESVKKEKEEKKSSKKEEEKDGMKITKTQLMKALSLNPHQEEKFKEAIKKGHSIADALATATKSKKD